MFDFIKKLFRRKKTEEGTAMEEKKIELSALTPDEDLKDIEMPESRYTQEYAEFVETQIPAAPAEKSLEEQMLEDPFADVAAQDEDFGVPELPETETPEEPEPEKKKSLEEQMLEDPFADISAEYEEVE